MSQPQKRKGEHSNQGGQAKKPLLETEPAPYDLVEDLTLVLPSQPLDVSYGLTKQRYARDLWTIFKEEALVDQGLAAMHKKWFEASRPAHHVRSRLICAHLQVRKPDAQELWESRYPVDETTGLNIKGSNRQGMLRTVRTLELVLDQVPMHQMPALHLSLSRVHLDYIMLMCIMCKFAQVGYLGKH